MFTIHTINNYRLVKDLSNGQFRVLNAKGKVVGWAINQSQGLQILTEIAYA